MRPIEWVWKYRLAKGEMAVLAGDGGLGKSSVLLDIAARVTTGREWADNSGHALLGSVVIVSAEDSRETTLKPRLVAMGADLDRIIFSTAKMMTRRKGKPPTIDPMTLQNREFWRESLRRVPDCRLLIFDPLPSYLGRGVNDAKNAELRALIEPFLDEVTRPIGVCLACNTHLNKSATGPTPVHRISGSHAYGALPRNVHFVVADKDAPNKRLFLQAKCNNAPAELPALRFEMTTATIPSPHGEIETAFPVWDAEPVTIDVASAMSSSAGSSKPGPSPSKTREVADWLFAYLRDAGHPVPLRDIFAQAGDKGFVGEYREDKEGKMRWSNSVVLYRARKLITATRASFDGYVVDECMIEKRMHWELTGPTNLNHLIHLNHQGKNGVSGDSYIPLSESPEVNRVPSDSRY
jgi:hypothetical protein